MKRFASTSCAILAVVLFHTTAFAQSEGVVQGIVIAKADRSLLSGAKVALQAERIGETLEATTEDGRFTFARLNSGQYVLTIDHPSFQQQRYEFTLRPREVQNITLELSLKEVQQTVDVVGEPLPSAHSPGSTLVTAEEIELFPLPQRSNLPDLVAARVPGMIRGHDDFVHIRGSEIALNPFINGVSFWENPHAIFSAGLGADYIKSMNIMTGGFSAEYGNRFGGVLDVVTKSGQSMDNHGSITIGAGTALRHNASVEFGGGTERFGYYANVAGFESARFLSPPDPRAIHDTGSAARGFLRFDFLANPQNSFRLVVMGDGANFEIPKTAQDAILRPHLDSFQRTRSQSLIASWDHVHSKDLLLQTSFYQRRSRSQLLPNDDPYGAKAETDRWLDTFGLKSDATRFGGRHTFKAGVDLVMLRPDEELYYLSQPWIDYTHVIGSSHIHFRGPNQGAGIPRPVVFDEKETGGQASAYIQDKIQLTRRLTVDVGLRYDAYDLAVSASHFSPRLNLAYTLSSGTVVYGAYNHFFVPPPIENVLMNSAGMTQYISEIGYPLPALRPIVEDQVELGVKQPLGRYINVGVTGYYRLSDNPVHTVLFPDVRVYGYANFDKGEAYGMEARLEMPMLASTGISGYLNYALGRVWFFNPITAGFTTEADHLNDAGRFLAPMDQTHTVTSAVTYRHRRTGLWGSLAMEYGSGTPAGHGGGDHEHESGEAAHEHAGAGDSASRVPGHFTQNLTVGWDVLRAGDQPRMTFQFNVENLTNNIYVVARESIFTPGQYSIPRLYSGSIKLRF